MKPLSQELRPEFPLMLAGFTKLIQVVAQRDFKSEDRWLVHAQTLIIKIYRHLESIHQLCNGVQTVVDGEKTDLYIDHSSVAVLARAAFETFLLFHFIFCTGPQSERRMKYLAWKMIGLKERQRLHRPKITTERATKVLASEQKEIARLEKLIYSHPDFLKLSTKAQGKVKANEIKMDYKWMDLAEMAELPRKYCFNMYSILCNYAHSNALSAFQIHDAIGDKSHVTLAGATITFCNVLLSQTILAYAKLFPEVDEALESDLTTGALVEMLQTAKNAMSEHFPA